MSHRDLPYQASDVAASAAHTAPAHGQHDEDDRSAIRSEQHARPHRVSTDRPLSPAQARAQAQRSAPSSPEAHAYAQLWRVVYSASLSWDSKLRRTHDVLAVLGLLNFAVVVALFQSCFNQRTLHFKLSPDECATYIPLQVAGGIFYVAFVITLCIYYYQKSGYKALLSLYPTRLSAFLHSGLLHRFLLELLLSLVQPVPLLGMVLDLSHAQWLVILALLAKLYLLVRVLRDHSEVYQQRMFLKQNTKFDTSYFAMDLLTVAKTYAYSYTLWVVTLGCTLNALFMAYLLHICERELWLPVSSHAGALPRRYVDMPGPVSITGGSGSGSELHEHMWGGGFVGQGSETLLQDGSGVEYFQSPYISLLNCVYFVGVVATTTGLGDIAPVSEQGKVFAVCTAVMGIIWSSFAVGVLTNKLVPSDFQAYCIDYMQKVRNERNKQRLAAILIQRCWRLHRQLAKEEAQSSGSRHRRTEAQRQERFARELGHAVIRFQQAQRTEANSHFIYIGVKEGAAALVGNGHDDRSVAMQAAGRQMGEYSPGQSFSAEGSPERRAQQQQERLGNGEVQRLSSRPANSRGGSSSSLLQRQNSRRGSSANGALARSEMSAEHAVRALHHLNRQPSRTATRSSSFDEAGMASPAAGSPRPSSLTRSGGYSANASALATLSAQNAALAATLRSMDIKLEQLVQAQYRASISENMLEGGHTFLSWTSNGRAGVGEDALSARMLLWLERDETKYGSLHWTTEEFAVNARLRIKVPGNTFPLHSITDVHLGKAFSHEWSLPACERLPPALCFTVVSKVLPAGLKLQAQYQEERTHWISQLKQAFLPRRATVPPSVQASPTGPRPTSSRRQSTDNLGAPHAEHRRSISLLPMSSPASTMATFAAMYSSSSAALASSSSSSSAAAAGYSQPPSQPSSPPTPSIGGRFKQ